ncbi:MAG: hypothetical protein ACYCPS_05325 [Candidatus Saccharimonadales bacterium]
MVITQAGASVYAQAQAGSALTFTGMAIGGGELVTTLASALSSGTQYTSLSVAALTSPVASGHAITIGTGSTTQSVTTSAAASIGATSIAVTAFTANANYASGTTVTLVADPTQLTALLNPIGTFSINSITVTGTTAKVVGVFQNANLTQNTYTCEIGLFATDPSTGNPVLYAYGNANAQGDYIQSYSDGPASRQFALNIAVGSATTVTATIPAGTYVLASTVGQPNGVAELDANGHIPQPELANGVQSFNSRTGAVVPASGDYTAAEVGAVPTSAEGAANGVATLDANGYVPQAQLANGVQQIIAGTGVTISPLGGTGKVTITNSATVADATQTAPGIVQIAQNPGGTPVAPVRVADAEEQTVTTAGAWVTVATFTPTQNGFFNVDAHFRITANTSVEWQVTYAGSQGAMTTPLLSNTAYTFTSGADNDYDVIPVSIRAVTGTAINVQVQASVASAVVASANVMGR